MDASSSVATIYLKKNHWSLIKPIQFENGQIILFWIENLKSFDKGRNGQTFSINFDENIQEIVKQRLRMLSINER